jgi:ribosomal protein S18 acetylase RimI-like enzyme
MADAARLVAHDPARPDLLFRPAGPGDASGVAALHADSWRRNYRGAYSDSFLDGDVDGFQLIRWTERLSAPDPQARTIVGDLDGRVVALAHTLVDEDPDWGALLDNLHVAHELKRRGIGARLLALTAQAVLDAAPGSGLYLWVLEQNAAAQAFYSAQGGVRVERRLVLPPEGNPNRLNGTPACFRYAWPDPSTLL